jgi:hypothetical protein
MQERLLIWSTHALNIAALQVLIIINVLTSSIWAPFLIFMLGHIDFIFYRKKSIKVTKRNLVMNIIGMLLPSYRKLSIRSIIRSFDHTG